MMAGQLNAAGRIPVVPGLRSSETATYNAPVLPGIQSTVPSIPNVSTLTGAEMNDGPVVPAAGSIFEPMDRAAEQNTPLETRIETTHPAETVMPDSDIQFDLEPEIETEPSDVDLFDTGTPEIDAPANGGNTTDAPFGIFEEGSTEAPVVDATDETVD